MNSRNLLIAQAIIGITFGSLLVLMPGSFLSHYILSPDDLTRFAKVMSQLYGAELIGIGIGCWIAKDQLNPKGWIWAIFFGCIIQLYIYLQALLTNAVSASSWISFGITAVMLLWAAYLLFIKKPNN